MVGDLVPKICWKCKIYPQEPYAHITHPYKGLTFSIFKDGLTCTPCAIRESQKLYDELAPKFLRRYGKGVRVRWNQYAKTVRFVGHDRDVDELLRLLEMIGVLSYSRRGCWDIVSDNLSLLPRLNLETLAFTKKNEAKMYARAMLNDTRYDWELRHISEVIPKSVVLNKS